MFRMQGRVLVRSISELSNIKAGKILINTINAHSYNVAQEDSLFAEALKNGDYLIPDGQSIVWASKLMRGVKSPKERISGWDLFEFEMEMLNKKGGKCFFMGSSNKVLDLIEKKAVEAYPNIQVESYSPPFKLEFSEEENKDIISRINESNPDLLWIGMTAPKQEKWAYSHWNELDINCHCGTIGAVFDFFAGTKKRAPKLMQRIGLEWLYRLCSEPKRMWRRYIVGNLLFIRNIIKELGS